MAKIEFKNITAKYKVKRKVYVTALDNVSGVFEEGKINVIIGQSGCGKTTLLRCIAGILDYTGEITFDDVPVDNMQANERRISYVSQMIGLYPNLSIFNNIAFPLKVTHCSGDEIRQRVGEVAKMLHIESLLARKPRELSIGQAQRVAIARAIVKRSNAYLFDEPFSNLDKALSSELSIEIKKLFETIGSTVIFVSHDINEALSISDYIFVMDEGKIIGKFTKENIFESEDERVKVLIKEKL